MFYLICLKLKYSVQLFSSHCVCIDRQATFFKNFCDQKPSIIYYLCKKITITCMKFQVLVLFVARLYITSTKWSFPNVFSANVKAFIRMQLCRDSLNCVVTSALSDP